MEYNVIQQYVWLVVAKIEDVSKCVVVGCVAVLVVHQRRPRNVHLQRRRFGYIYNSLWLEFIWLLGRSMKKAMLVADLISKRARQKGYHNQLPNPLEQSVRL